jgi:hypothetical protein
MEAAKVSFGHAADEPVQVSVTSHAPADALQMVPAEEKVLLGHIADEPEQNSAGSQTP